MLVRLAGKQDIYLEIAGQYKHFIDMEVLKQDEKLPSCRALALELGINPNTVERAYSVLEEEGYIVSIPKKGVFVKDRGEVKNNLTQNAQTHIGYYKKAGLTYEQMSDILKSVYKAETSQNKQEKIE